MRWTHQLGPQGGEAPYQLDLAAAGENKIAVLEWEHPGKREPAWSGALSVLDMRTGVELWRTSLQEFGVGKWVDVAVGSTSAEGHLMLAIINAPGPEWARVYALDPMTGRVVAQTTLDDDQCSSLTKCPGDIGWSSREGYPFLVTTVDSVMRIATGELGGDPLWTAPLPEAISAAMAGERGDAPHVSANGHGYIVAEGLGGDLWLDAETGVVPPWYSGLNHDTRYKFVGDSIMRVEKAPPRLTIEAFDREGRMMWTKFAGQVAVKSSASEELLFFMELNEEDEMLTSSEYLVRVDPVTGNEMWETPYQGPFKYNFHVFLDGVLVQDDDSDSRVLLDSWTGEELLRTEDATPYERKQVPGTTLAFQHDYSNDLFRAWSLASGSELWSLDTDGHRVVRVATGVFLVDNERARLTRVL